MSLQAQNCEPIIVVKKNVTHKFVRFDEETDGFASKVFQNWENETFDVFDSVKNSEAIAIDLGAWIGTTAIWLSKNFHHVLAVECDKVSLACLEKNLEASDCKNITICKQPIAEKTEDVIFGPRGSNLNQSISCIKNEASSYEDYQIRSMTFKQLLYDYLYANESLRLKNISFIKCDIEGGEENIIEDVLHFCYNNNCTAYISFHLSWWTSKSIKEVEYLFDYFETNCPSPNICEYLENNPFASILFKPLKTTKVLIKKNMPSVVIGYNLVSYIKQMVEQLEKYTSDITIIDNNSNYKPLLDYYNNDFKYTLLRMNSNYGCSVYLQDPIQKIVGDLYILTDPDLQFNPKLPDNFIATFINISNYFGANRVGFALSIDSDEIRTDTHYGEFSIKKHESQFWKHKLHYPFCENLELYAAGVDTTFCLINRKFPNDQPIRVAGDYTCFHLPWHKDFRASLQNGEYESYLQHNKSTTWFAEQ